MRVQTDGKLSSWVPLAAAIYAIVAPAAGAYGGMQYSRGQDTIREQQQDALIANLQSRVVELDQGRERNRLSIEQMMAANGSDHDWIKRALVDLRESLDRRR